jgi:DeoR family transcriptional regulator of aga operon
MTKQLIPAQRHEMIREYAETHQIIRSADLSELLDVSEATVRRDLEWLEGQGILERTHGGAILSQQVRAEPEYSSNVLTHAAEKRRIGAAAAALVDEGDIIFVNSGTTTTQIIRHLDPAKRVTVVTNNVSAALEMQESNVRMVLLGGALRPRSNSIVGQYALDTLRHIYANKAFFGVDGISIKYGCTVVVQGEGEIIRRMIERTHGLVTVAADSSKWGAVSSYEVASIDQIHCLVTDDGLDQTDREALGAHSVNVIAATQQVSDPAGF